MLLHDLLRQFDPFISLTGVPNAPIAGVREDSRRVKPGDLFVARPSIDGKSDGTQFIPGAIANGAVAVVGEAKVPGLSVAQITVPNAGLAVGLLAQAFHGRPTEKVRTLAVTGTNGKTTTAYLIRHILGKVKQKCGMIGTVEIDDGRSVREAEMTTPGPCELAEMLATMRDHGASRCAIEVSSHALHQNRVAGMKFAAAGFTNLTGDHLDYHKDLENYAAAKAKLFESLEEDAIAVVNVEDPWSRRMVQDCRGRIIGYGIHKEGDYQARDIAVTAAGTHFILVTPDGRAEVEMRLIGRHNIENALLAAAMVGETFGISVHQIAAALKDAAGAPGRLQPVVKGQPFGVLVDYAHTDDALRNVLTALRPLTRGKLRVLFGCGGNRDTTKRPRMAIVAEQLADAVYVTSDNPRKEEPEAIINEIFTGFSPRARRTAAREADRAAAIERILSDAEPGDVVLIAGKGHENYQIIGETKRHFDDVEQAERVLATRVAGV